MAKVTRVEVQLALSHLVDKARGLEQVDDSFVALCRIYLGQIEEAVVRASTGEETK